MATQELSAYVNGLAAATLVGTEELYLDTDEKVTVSKVKEFVLGGIATRLVVPVSSAQTATIGATPIQILPAPGAGKYYEYTYVIEKTGGSTVAGTLNFYFIGTGTSFIGNLFDPLTFQNAIDGYVSGSSRSNESSNGSLNYTTINGLNENIVFTTYNSNNPTSSASTFRVIITYIERTFGA